MRAPGCLRGTPIEIYLGGIATIRILGFPPFGPVACWSMYVLPTHAASADAKILAVGWFSSEQPDDQCANRCRGLCVSKG